MANKKLYFIVDDDPIIRKLVVARLSSDNVTVEPFDSGEGCVGALKMKPDLIILDYIFSGSRTSYRDGMEVFDMIKEMNPNIPVIMLSGQEDGEVVLELARKGIVDYIIKDTNLINNLITAIADHFEDR